MDLNSTQFELINGSLLGDGCLAPRKHRKNTRFVILRKLDDIDYLKWQFSFMENLCKTGIKSKFYFDKRTNKTYGSCYFATIANEQLTNISKKWYHDGGKHIPVDLELTPLCLGIWFLDDGNIRYTSSKKALQLTFATNCFLEQEVKMLSQKLQDKFGGYFGVYSNSNKYVISCSTKPAINILKYISPVIPKNILPRKTIYLDQYVFDQNTKA